MVQQYPISEMVSFDAYQVADDDDSPDEGASTIVVREVANNIYKVMNLPDQTIKDVREEPYFYSEDAIWYVQGKANLNKLLSELYVEDVKKKEPVVLFDVVRMVEG